LLLPKDARGLLPLALTWAFLSAPGAMDEAAAVAERLGGARFVEALRAHGYSGARIFLVHIVGYNLRPVVVRIGAETMMHVVFLEIALSYLALSENQPSFTHADSQKSWADLLQLGYPSMIPSLDVHSGHALALGLVLLGLIAGTSIAIGQAARAR
jgi:ABC-type dipeptide/oligopeptide/nickel transport system permease subunit